MLRVYAQWNCMAVAAEDGEYMVVIKRCTWQTEHLRTEVGQTDMHCHSDAAARRTPLLFWGKQGPNARLETWQKWCMVWRSEAGPSTSWFSLPLLLSLTNTVMFWKSSWITLNHPRLHHHASFIFFHRHCVFLNLYKHFTVFTLQSRSSKVWKTDRAEVQPDEDTMGSLQHSLT